MSKGHLPQTLIKLGGKEYAVHPTFQMVSKIENGTGLGIMGLMRRLGEMDLKTVDLATILFHMISDQGDIKIEEIGEEVNGRLLEFIAPIGDFLQSCVSGSDEMPTTKVSAEGNG